MTREEKIALLVDELEDIRCANFDADTDEDKTLKEAIKAIKALEQEPCDDAISRQAVLAETYSWSKDEFLRVTNPFDYLRKKINSLPSVTPQQNPNIKALGEDMRICQKSITDEKVLIGFNMAVAICNKHLAESEEEQ